MYQEGANKNAYNSQWKGKQRTYCTKLRSILFVQPKDRPFHHIPLLVSIVLLLARFFLRSVAIIIIIMIWILLLLLVLHLLWLFTLNLLVVYINNCSRCTLYAACCGVMAMAMVLCSVCVCVCVCYWARDDWGSFAHWADTCIVRAKQYKIHLQFTSTRPIHSEKGSGCLISHFIVHNSNYWNHIQYD